VSEKLKALIVGCGNIAGGYDERGTYPSAVLTHAGAYKAHGGFEISACVEPDAARREVFMNTWGVEQGCTDLVGCAALGQVFDVVSLCSPSSFHADDLRTLLTMPVRAVFAEKPLTGDSNTSLQIIEAFAAKQILIAVNYTRRWSPGLAQIRADIVAGKWGRVTGGIGRYSKGLYNCGSHMIDLVNYLVGPVVPEQVFSKIEDFSASDPTLSVFMKFENDSQFVLIGSDGRDFFTFELTLITEKGEIVIEDLGRRVRYRLAEPHALYSTQITLPVMESVDTGFDGAMLAAITNIADHLNKGKSVPSDGMSAFHAERTCAEIMRLTENFDSGEAN